MDVQNKIHRRLKFDYSFHNPASNITEFKISNTREKNISPILYFIRITMSLVRSLLLPHKRLKDHLPVRSYPHNISCRAIALENTII